MPRAISIALLAATLAGCASGGSHTAGPLPQTVAAPEATTASAGQSRSLEIELIGYPGCPNTPEMRENLRAALRDLGGGLTFREVDQRSLPPTDPRRGWPAPTVLVNGRDLFGLAAPPSPMPTCRLYDGGLPGPRAIARHLQRGIRRAARTAHSTPGT